MLFERGVDALRVEVVEAEQEVVGVGRLVPDRPRGAGGSLLLAVETNLDPAVDLHERVVSG